MQTIEMHDNNEESMNKSLTMIYDRSLQESDVLSR